MAKPILFVQLPLDFKIEFDTIPKIKNNLTDQTDGEYHILLVFSNVENILMETLNDCKGLKDEDIEALCNVVMNSYKQAKETIPTDSEGGE